MCLLQKSGCWLPKQWRMLGRPHYRKLLPPVQMLLVSWDIPGATGTLSTCALCLIISLIQMSIFRRFVSQVLMGLVQNLQLLWPMPLPGLGNVKKQTTIDSFFK